MKLRTFFLVLLLAAALGAWTGCQKRSTVLMEPPELPKDYTRPLPDGELALRKISDPARIPDYTKACSQLDGLAQAIDHSLRYLAKPSSKTFYPYGEITHERAVKTLQELKQLVAAGLPPERMNRILREKFDTYISVGCDDRGTVLFTGYYTPVFDGSPTRTDRFRYPLYKSPANLEKEPDGTIKGLRKPDGKIARVPDRAEIARTNPFAGNEIVWLADPFEVYIVHVQGSARIRLPDGRVETLGYEAHNGWEYKGIVHQMIADGKISAGDINLRAMIAYFKAHPEDVDRYVHQNPRFVFFRPEAGNPRGSLNEPVTPFRTLATDKAIYPRAMFAFAAVNLEAPVGFALDQDTGGAIRAAGRCDVYMGTGDRAGELAGGTYREGKLYYLFLK
ncbi:MAG: MltA domain-containing protein [Deltaproteobacteria bacterium]|jgi:membrane-bound lytic murein transglycosylase A